MLLDGACVVSCPANFAVLPSATGSAPTCAPCHETCGGSCLGPAADQCTACDSFGLNSFLLGGQCMLACPDGHYADEQRVCQAHAPLATQIPLATHISHLPRTSHCHAHLALVTHVPLPRTFRTCHAPPTARIPHSRTHPTGSHPTGRDASRNARRAPARARRSALAARPTSALSGGGAQRALSSRPSVRRGPASQTAPMGSLSMRRRAGVSAATPRASSALAPIPPSAWTPHR